MKQIRQILEGWTNDLLNKINLLPEDKKKVAEDRLKICMGCPIRTNDICDPKKASKSMDGKNFNGCGCYIEKKTMCMDCDCPGSYWKAVKL